MDKIEIDGTERVALEKLLDEFEAEFRRLPLEESLGRATVYAHELPTRLRTVLNSFRMEKMSGVLCISGYRVDQERIGPTLAHWRDRKDPSSALREELLLILYSSLLGDPFAWATQQNGRLVHDILPIQGHEKEQLGSSSESLLTWHTEDAFHPLRGDFLAFACIRNPYQAATTVGYVDSLELSDDTRAVLFEERFTIRPDESHLAKNNFPSGSVDFQDIEEMWRNPRFIAVLFGDPDRPYVRADPYFMAVREGDEEAQRALDEFTAAMDRQMFDLKLRDGDFCFLDNFRVVHGRKPFKARHDGTDRWLKRVNITCDLRRARAAGATETPWRVR